MIVDVRIPAGATYPSATRAMPNIPTEPEPEPEPEPEDKNENENENENPLPPFCS